MFIYKLKIWVLKSAYWHIHYSQKQGLHNLLDLISNMKFSYFVFNLEDGR